MCEDTPDRLAAPVRHQRHAAPVEHPGVLRQLDLTHCSQWLQREAGGRWRAGTTILVLWVAPDAKLAGAHPERCEPMLAEAGRLLRARLRAVDWVLQLGQQAVVAVLCVPKAGVQAAVQRRLQQALAAPMVLNGDLVQVRLRTGTAAVAGPDADAHALLALARSRCLAS